MNVTIRVNSIRFEYLKGSISYRCIVKKCIFDDKNVTQMQIKRFLNLKTVRERELRACFFNIVGINIYTSR